MKAYVRWAILLLVLLVIGTQSKSWAAPEADLKSTVRTFKVNGAVELVVKTGSEDLRVRGGEDGQVVIRCIIKAPNDDNSDDEDLEKAAQSVESNLPVRQEGNRILIDPLGNRELLRRLNVEYELTVPANTRLTHETGSGDLMVEAIRGPVDFRSGSGDAQIRSVQEGVRVHTGSGDVSLEDVGEGAIEVETHSGDAMVRLDSKTGYDVTARTGSGDFSIAPELTLEASDTRSEVRGKVRGGGTPVSVRTGSGDIRIE